MQTSFIIGSSKETKIETKRVPAQFSQKFCWICHQTDRIDPGSPEEKHKNLSLPIPTADFFRNPFNTAKKSEKNEFKPCLCKGSLENVHRECLNLWALKKYQNYIKNFSEKEEEILFGSRNFQRNELKIKCPNCKFQLKYNVVEKRVFRVSHFFNLDTKEKVSLFFLILLQIMFLFYDLRSLYKESFNEVGERSYIENISHILYIVTVLIILSAGTFNLLDLIGKEIELEVLDKDE